MNLGKLRFPRDGGDGNQKHFFNALFGRIIRGEFMGHFPAMLLCAGLISVAFAALSQRTAGKRFSRALLYFVVFVVISVAIGWLMYPFSH
ncbi:MAG: hypothetical protein ACYDCM_00080 [Candidatus Acidiferrales bacterium]